MSGSVEKEALDVAPPIASASTDGNDGVFAKATTTSSQRFIIPEGWRGRFVTFASKTSECQILFGTSTVSVTVDQESTINSEAITTNAATGFPIPADGEKSWRIPRNKSVTHFAVRANVAGVLFAYPSTNRLKDGFV